MVAMPPIWGLGQSSRPDMHYQTVEWKMDVQQLDVAHVRHLFHMWVISLSYDVHSPCQMISIGFPHACEARNRSLKVECLKIKLLETRCR
jgi:hypothetical protein